MRGSLRPFLLALFAVVMCGCASYDEDGALVRRHFGYVRVITPAVGGDGASVQSLRIETLGMWLDVDRRTGARQQGSGAGMGWRSDQRDFFAMDARIPTDCRFVLRVANDTQFEQARTLIESQPSWRGGCVITDQH
ncbi:MAG: hypothetical protein ACK4X1_06435 [Terricaulis sp.]